MTNEAQFDNFDPNPGPWSEKHANGPVFTTWRRCFDPLGDGQYGIAEGKADDIMRSLGKYDGFNVVDVLDTLETLLKVEDANHSGYRNFCDWLDDAKDLGLIHAGEEAAARNLYARLA